jgi:hypothetical protein
MWWWSERSKKKKREEESANDTLNVVKWRMHKSKWSGVLYTGSRATQYLAKDVFVAECANACGLVVVVDDRGFFKTIQALAARGFGRP